MKIPFGVTTTRRDRGGLPRLPLVNMIAEPAQTEETQVALQSRPGLTDTGIAAGADPVVGIFRKDGVLAGSKFTVTRGASTRLWRDGALVGTIDGTGPVSMAGNEIGLAVCAGASIWYYSGTSLAKADTDSAFSWAKIVEIESRFVAVAKGTQRFYWTESLFSALVAGILTFDPLNYASAENEPDQLYDALVMNDFLVLFGAETVETWSRSTSDTLPFDPIPGRVYRKGIKATGACAEFDNGAYWVSPDNIVYLASNEPQRISDNGIEERIGASASVSLFSFFWEGHELLTLRLDSECYNYDAQTKLWPQFESNGGNWAASCATKGPLFGSANDSRILQFGASYTDLGNAVERRFGAGMAMNGSAVSVSNLRLRCNTGAGAYASDPVVEMRFSRDAGKTWSEWRPTRLGATGSSPRVEWRALGMFTDPGMLFEFRVTDDVDFRASGVTVNEPGGGRSR